MREPVAAVLCLEHVDGVVRTRSGRHGVHGGRSAEWIAAGIVQYRLAQHDVGDRIDRLGCIPQHLLHGVPLVRHQRLPLAGLEVGIHRLGIEQWLQRGELCGVVRREFVQQQYTVDDVVGRDRLFRGRVVGTVGVVEPARHEWCQIAQAELQAGEALRREAALDLVADQAAELLARAHSLDESVSLLDAHARKVDRERSVALLRQVRQVRAAQYSRGHGVPRRRCVDPAVP